MAKWVKGLLYKLNDPSSMPATHIKVEGRESSPQRCHLISISMLWYPSPQHHTYTPKNNNKNVIWMVGKIYPRQILFLPRQDMLPANQACVYVCVAICQLGP